MNGIHKCKYLHKLIALSLFLFSIPAITDFISILPAEFWRPAQVPTHFLLASLFFLNLLSFLSRPLHSSFVGGDLAVSRSIFLPNLKKLSE